MADERNSVSLAIRAIDRLNVAPEVKEVLRMIQADVHAAYAQNFAEMLTTLRQQASAINRIQTTLQLLIEQVAPVIAKDIPVAIGVAKDGANPDLASAVVVADPIGSGFTLSQTDLARVLELGSPEVSILTRALRLTDDENVAVVVRRGPEGKNSGQIVNYHPRAAKRFVELVFNPPAHQALTASQKATLRRVREKLAERGMQPAEHQPAPRTLGRRPR